MCLCCVAVATEPQDGPEGGSDMNEGAPAAKKPRIGVSDFEDDVDDTSGPVDADEVTAYLQTRVDPSNHDILAWWTGGNTRVNSQSSRSLPVSYLLYQPPAHRVSGRSAPLDTPCPNAVLRCRQTPWTTFCLFTLTIRPKCCLVW